MTTMEEKVALAVQEQDFSVKLDKILDSLKTIKNVSRYSKNSYVEYHDYIDRRDHLDVQIQFIDNALFFLETIVPDHGGLDDLTLMECHAVLNCAVQLRQQSEMNYTCH